MKKIFLCSLLIALGMLAGVCIERYGGADSSAVHADHLRDHDPAHTFINPLLACSYNEKQEPNRFDRLKEKFADFVEEKKRAGIASDISVYFRDLNSGLWTGINEDDKYSPASMMKVQVMMAHFKLADSEPGYLQKKAIYMTSGVPQIPVHYAYDSGLVSGKEYSYQELIDSMIINSDNYAMYALVGAIDQKILERIYSQMQIEIPEKFDPSADFASAKNYSLTLRILYNGTFLSRDFSNESLRILSQSRFKNGIAAGVPQNVIVANKFGERSKVDGSDGELHDCGIVYYTSKPYVLCVMTKGKNFDDLTEVIKGLSLICYEEAVKNPE
jgi:beta-lactamase class A